MERVRRDSSRNTRKRTHFVPLGQLGEQVGLAIVCAASPFSDGAHTASRTSRVDLDADPIRRLTFPDRAGVVGRGGDDQTHPASHPFVGGGRG